MGAGLVAVNGAFIDHALSHIAHMPVAFCLVWGCLLLLWWSDRPSVWTIFLAGFVLGCIPSTRYADSVIAIGVAAFLVSHRRSVPNFLLHFAIACGGALLAILPLLIRNQLVMGAFWRTGYSISNEQTGFGLSYFVQHFAGYMQMLAGSGGGLLFGLAVIGAVWMLWSKETRAMGLLLTFATVPFVMVYMSYYWGGGGGGGGGRGGPGAGGGPGGGGGANLGALRFLVPVIPIIVVGGVWTLSQMLRSAPAGLRMSTALAIVAFQLFTFGGEALTSPQREAQQKVPMAQVTQKLIESTSKEDVVIANASMLQHLDFVGEWKLADASVIGEGRGMMRRGGAGGGGAGDRAPGNRSNGAGPGGRDANAPSPMQFEKVEARMKLYPGSSEEKQLKFQEDLLTWAGEKQIIVVGTESELTRLLPGVDRAELDVITIVRTDDDRPPEDARDFPGPGGEGAPPGAGPPDNNGPGGMGGPAGMAGPGNTRSRRGGGPMGPAYPPSDEILIARWRHGM
jgi:hypothetical protein